MLKYLPLTLLRHLPLTLLSLLVLRAATEVDELHQPLPWQRAHQACQEMGGSLYAPRNSNLTELRPFINENQSLWLGGRRAVTSWTWTDNTKLFRYTGCYDDRLIQEMSTENHSQILHVSECFSVCSTTLVALKIDSCQCLDDSSKLVNLADDSLCNYTCAANFQDRCGGKTSYSVYTSDGPTWYRLSIADAPGSLPPGNQCGYLRYDGVGIKDSASQPPFDLKIDRCDVAYNKAMCQTCQVNNTNCQIALTEAYNDWQSAQQDCHKIGMNLLWPTNVDPRQCFNFLQGTEEKYWVGLKRETVLAWFDGTPLSITEFDISEPGDCLTVVDDEGGKLVLSFGDCSKPRHFLCDEGPHTLSTWQPDVTQHNQPTLPTTQLSGYCINYPNVTTPATRSTMAISIGITSESTMTERDTTEKTNVQKDTTETTNVQKDTTETKIVQKDTTETTNVQKDTPEPTNVQKDTTETTNVQKDTTETTNIQKDTTETTIVPETKLVPLTVSTTDSLATPDLLKTSFKIPLLTVNISADKITSPNPTDKLTSRNPTDKPTSPNPTDKLTSPNATDKLTSPNPTNNLTSPNQTDKLTSPNSTDKLTSPNPTDKLTSANPTDKLTSPRHSPNPTDKLTSPNPTDKLTSPRSSPNPTTQLQGSSNCQSSACSHGGLHSETFLPVYLSIGIIIPLSIVAVTVAVLCHRRRSLMLNDVTEKPFPHQSQKNIAISNSVVNVYVT